MNISGFYHHTKAELVDILVELLNKCKEYSRTIAQLEQKTQSYRTRYEYLMKKYQEERNGSS